MEHIVEQAFKNFCPFNLCKQELKRKKGEGSSIFSTEQAPGVQCLHNLRQLAMEICLEQVKTMLTQSRSPHEIAAFVADLRFHGSKYSELGDHQYALQTEWTKAVKMFGKQLAKVLILKPS